jgi:hypothetical protein
MMLLHGKNEKFSINSDSSLISPSNASGRGDGRKVGVYVLFKLVGLFCFCSRPLLTRKERWSVCFLLQDLVQSCAQGGCRV